MPNTKNNDQKITVSQSTNNKQNNKNKVFKKGGGMQPGAMPHIPTAREKAKDMDSSRRGNAQTFEL